MKLTQKLEFFFRDKEYRKLWYEYIVEKVSYYTEIQITNLCCELCRYNSFSAREYIIKEESEEIFKDIILVKKYLLKFRKWRNTVFKK